MVYKNKLAKVLWCNLL